MQLFPTNYATLTRAMKYGIQILSSSRHLGLNGCNMCCKQ